MTLKKMVRSYYLDNDNCAPSFFFFFWGHCVKSGVIVLDLGIFLWGSAAPEEK